HPGCWIDPERAARKIGALGIRVERGVSYHGIALNVDPNLDDFGLIDPCGMPGLVSTSIAVEAGWPGGQRSADAVEHSAAILARALAGRLGADLAGFGTGPAPRSGGLDEPLAAAVR
ncbi:MAG TPA: hypothetical protein VE640_07930, partial [Candidatus Bathyarchaeia archaeon]|nr:hypothetical protein [Candidatus Bathyarchaeia archaeon]